MLLFPGWLVYRPQRNDGLFEDCALLELCCSEASSSKIPRVCKNAYIYGANYTHKNTPTIRTNTEEKIKGIYMCTKDLR